MPDTNLELDPTPLHITPQEREALLLLAEAKAKADLTMLFARMGVATATDAVAAAVRRGLIDSSHSVNSPSGGRDPNIDV